MLAEPLSQFANEYDDTTTGSASTTVVGTGVQLSPPFSILNTMGAWSQIVSVTDQDWYGVWMVASAQISTSGQNTAQMVNIGVGGSGSESVLIPNILVGGRTSISGAISFSDTPMFFPVRIPRGTRIAAQTQAATVNRNCRVIIWGESGSSVPRGVLSACDVYGADASTSKGVELTSNASANTFGSWTNVGSTTSRDYKAVAFSMQAPASTTVNSRSYIIEFGIGSTAFARAYGGTSANETWSTAIPAMPVVRNIPAGTQLQARISCGTAANADLPSVAMHCMY